MASAKAGSRPVDTTAQSLADGADNSSRIAKSHGDRAEHIFGGFRSSQQ